MPLWDQSKSTTQTVNGQLKTRADQLRSKDFTNASMARCALIAAADGLVASTERQKTAEFGL
jgi:tellurite resistance protein TerB